MRRLRSLLAALLLTVIAGFGAPAAAIGLDAARSQGLVGETRSGYLAPVQSPSAEVQALVNSVNAKRRDHYRSISSRNGVAIEEVGRLTAEKLINSLPSGLYYQSAGGGWQRK